MWSDGERFEFIGWIADNPLAGDVIPSAGGLRKVRWARAGMGKRGGARVIYYTRLANGELVLLLVYAKAKFDNLRPEFLLKLKEKFDDSSNGEPS
ncbi:MAG: transcriptional regulator [Leptothrix ochracea]|uniref:transcriptional regulator n=1 Tax=Leptothrix ochracea TaxID=735331 RepID=UPI0034E2D9C5